MQFKDTIIISELSRTQTLLLPPRIKAVIKEREGSNNLKEGSIVANWVELFGLGRLVIIFDSAENAQAVFSELKTALSDCEQISINLSETILKRHKSQESLKEPPSPIPALNETGLYREPSPFSKPTRSNSVDLMELNIPNHDYNIKSNETLTLLKPLEIPKELSPIRTSFDNDKEVEQGNQRNIAPMSPTITFERVEL